jgi:hypothetical protein
MKENLEKLLSTPEVWNYVNNNHASKSALMMDVRDGLYTQNHELFHRNPTALQIIVSCDDLEISNPLGAHVKKHKVCIVYFSLGNIPPQFHSQLSVIQLIGGVAKSQHLRNRVSAKVFE